MEMHTGTGSDNFCSYQEASALLYKYANGACWTAHCVAVSSLATHLVGILSSRYPLDIEFVRTAALLHDIGRFKTHHPIMHGVEGYRLLTRLGYPNEAFVCASHILYGLDNSEAVGYGLPKRDFIPLSLEERFVPLVDFLIEHDRPTSLRERFENLRNRNRDDPRFLSKLDRAEQKAEAFMNQLNRELNVSIEALSFDFFGKK